MARAALQSVYLLAVTAATLPAAAAMEPSQLGLELKAQALENQVLAGVAPNGLERYGRFEGSARFEGDWQAQSWSGQIHYLAFAEYQDLPLPPDPQTARRSLDLASYGRAADNDQ